MSNNALINSGITFTKGNQVEHVQIYKSLVQYRLRFGITGNVFFRKPAILTNLRAKQIAQTAEQATDHLAQLKKQYLAKGFRVTQRMAKFSPTKRAYYILTKRPLVVKAPAGPAKK